MQEKLEEDMKVNTEEDYDNLYFESFMYGDDGGDLFHYCLLMLCMILILVCIVIYHIPNFTSNFIQLIGKMLFIP